MWIKTTDAMPDENGYYITVYYYAITHAYVYCLDNYDVEQSSFIDHYGNNVNNRIAWIKIPPFTQS